MIGWRHGAVLALLAGCCAGQALAQTPSGMVMEVSGGTEPAIQALTEVEPGFTVKLAAGAKLSFVHYTSCKLVSVEGGTVTMKLSAYTVDGKVLSEQKRCPKRFALAAGGSTEAGGMVLRGAPAIMSTRPIFLITGSGADGVVSAELRQDGKVVGTLPINARRASLPDATPALPAGGDYDLVVKTKAGEPITRKFRAVETAADPLDRSVVLSIE